MTYQWNLEKNSLLKKHGVLALTILLKPLMQVLMDIEEMEIFKAMEASQLKRSINSNEEIYLAQQAARDYLSKSSNLTINLNPVDVNAIKSRSHELGISYQALISSLVHQYVIGKIILEPDCEKSI